MSNKTEIHRITHLQNQLRLKNKIALDKYILNKNQLQNMDSNIKITDLNSIQNLSPQEIIQNLYEYLDVYLKNMVLSKKIVDTFSQQQQSDLIMNWFIAEERLNALKTNNTQITQNMLRSLLYSIIQQYGNNANNIPVNNIGNNTTNNNTNNNTNTTNTTPIDSNVNLTSNDMFDENMNDSMMSIDNERKQKRAFKKSHEVAELRELFSRISATEMRFYISDVNRNSNVGTIKVIKQTIDPNDLKKPFTTANMNVIIDSIYNVDDPLLYVTTLIEKITEPASSSSSSSNLVTPSQNISGAGLKNKKRITFGAGYCIPICNEEKKLSFKEYEKPISKKFYIDLNKLKSNLLEIKYLKNKHLSSIKSYHISNGCKKVIEDMTHKKSFRHQDYNKLNNIEKNLVRKVMSMFEIYADLDDDDDFQKEFELLKGEILAGNNSNELKQKMNAYLLHAVNTSRISRHNFQSLCLELGV
jgi:hypothetical protein